MQKVADIKNADVKIHKFFNETRSLSNIVLSELNIINTNYTFVCAIIMTSMWSFTTIETSVLGLFDSLVK